MNYSDDNIAYPLVYAAGRKVMADGIDLLEGDASVTDKQDRVLITGHFADNVRDGEWHYFDERGAVRGTELWSKGRLITASGEPITDYSGFGYSGGSRGCGVRWVGHRSIAVKVVIGPYRGEDKGEEVFKFFQTSEGELWDSVFYPELGRDDRDTVESRIRDVLNSSFGDVVARVVVSEIK
ncbi:MAG: hypothetical protein IT462_04635 [Planctomycetes bacterium]|nr:hypothetical protein [Planctomycetota bacterium]